MTDFPSDQVHDPLGLTLAGTGFTYLNAGATAYIFVDRSTGRVRKIFKKFARYSHVRAVFLSEMNALEIACKTPDLRDLTPKFFGQVAEERIMDRTGLDRSDLMYGELGFELEHLGGKFAKIFDIVGPDERQKLQRRFASHGIHGLRDASGLIEQGVVVKLIDFAMNEIELFADSSEVDSF